MKAGLVFVRHFELRYQPISSDSDPQRESQEISCYIHFVHVRRGLVVSGNYVEKDFV